MLIEHGEMVKLQKVQWSNEIYGDNYFFLGYHLI